jgi:DNA-binding MarR family transcriptional regulator
MTAEAVFDQLLEVSLLLEADMSRSMAELGLTVTRTHLLWEVQQSGPCTQQRLAQAIGVSPRHVTGLVDALESDGFARRLPHPQDRRAVLVALTDKGTATMTRMQDQRRQAAGDLVADLDDAAVEQLRESLDAVLARLRQLVADAEGDSGSDSTSDSGSDR